MEQCYQLPCLAVVTDFTWAPNWSIVSFLTPMLFIVREDDSQDKDIPLFLLFQLLPSYGASLLFPEASDSCRVHMQTTKRWTEPETKNEYLTHLRSPISYLIVNLRTADLIYLFVISILNKLLLWLPCTWYTMHTSIFVNFLPHLGKNININGPKSLNTERLLCCIVF